MSYANHFENNEFHGYSFKNENEYNSVISMIKEAIPVLRFDNYSLPDSRPSICVDVHLDDDSANFTSNSIPAEKIESVVNQLTSEVNKSTRFIQFLDEACKSPPLTLEQITKELMDMERVIFQYTWEAYPIIFWKNPNFFEILRKSYSTYYSDEYTNFELFLIDILSLIRERYFARLVFENYSEKT